MKPALILFFLVGIVYAVEGKGEGDSKKGENLYADSTSTSHAVECETQEQRDHYCFNGGTCERYPGSINDGPRCRCRSGFEGDRCQEATPGK
ncbi:low-density lipoprotein receptor-related protein 1B-like [Montipora capricornis]|uniref:low-density lipoprotein receptor-related protein 1B-like n=1 Tax=Montipora foliosa TaxID=591990 RepID=UPI0035F12D62